MKWLAAASECFEAAARRLGSTAGRRAGRRANRSGGTRLSRIERLEDRTLLSVGEIHGAAWNDLDGDGLWNASIEPGLPARHVYIDEDLSGAAPVPLGNPKRVNTCYVLSGTADFIHRLTRLELARVTFSQVVNEDKRTAKLIAQLEHVYIQSPHFLVVV